MEIVISANITIEEKPISVEIKDKKRILLKNFTMMGFSLVPASEGGTIGSELK
jgi:hypothetical protein